MATVFNPWVDFLRLVDAEKIVEIKRVQDEAHDEFMDRYQRRFWERFDRMEADREAGRKPQSGSADYKAWLVDPTSSKFNWFTITPKDKRHYQHWDEY